MASLRGVIIIWLCIVVTTMCANAQTAVEVAHWWTSKGEARAVEVVKKAFEDQGYQWMDSAIVGGGGGTLIKRLHARVAAGSPPAAVQMFMGPNVWHWGEANALANLDSIAKQGNWKAVLPPLINRMIQYDGHYVAVPINAHRVNWMWINPAIFKKVGVRVPQTWEQFFICAEKIQNAGYIPLAIGGQPWQEATLFESVLLGIGGVEFHREAIIEQNPKALRSQTMIKVFETMHRIKQYTDKDTPGRDWDVATSMVMNGQAAMQIMGDWAKGEFLAAGKKPETDFDCVSCPGTNQIFLIDTDTIAMFSLKDKKIRAAQEKLAQIVMDPVIQKRFNLIKGSIPARMDIQRSDFDSCAQKAMDIFRDAATNDRIVPAFSYSQANSPDVQKVMVELVSAHFNSNMSAKEAAKKLAALVKAAK